MTLQTGRQPGDRGRAPGFTLIELILVLALLAVVSSFVAPALGRFARGRSLDAEARQLLALTRAAQSRAVSDGTPMVLWIDPQGGAYGLRREWSATIGDPKPLNFRLDSNLRLEPVSGAVAGLMPVQQAMVPTTLANGVPREPSIRFTPEGVADEASPQVLRLTDADGHTLWLVETRNRMGYEIRDDLR
jgi:type II secretion system protein H